ncbi:hypothetical protein ABH922_001902 [Rhodococcus sp. 27YEA15]|uniref:hypothetical protein n=1 Tax=Rhodococcus sp. 27YEA15 TaxID=3156259 RepID=UPI003C7B289D
MSDDDDHTTVLEFLQGGVVGPALDTPIGTLAVDAIEQSAFAPVLGMDMPVLPPPPDLSTLTPALPDLSGLSNLGSLLPSLPVLPSVPNFLLPAPAPVIAPNPIESLMSGAGLPAIPGVTELVGSLLDLAKGLGTGTFSGIDPVAIFNQASSLIDKAMGLSRNGLADVGQTWKSNAHEATTDLVQSAQRSGSELSDRGVAISNTTAAAAESVQRGNAHLAAIAESFASTVIAAAPVALTPPGQAMLIASAVEHLQAAVAAVTQTRGEMFGHTAAMNALAGPIPVPAAPIGEAVSKMSDPRALTDGINRLVGSAEPSRADAGVGTGRSVAAPYDSNSSPSQTTAAHAGGALPVGTDRAWGAGGLSAPSSAGVTPTAGSAGAWAGGGAAGAGPLGAGGLRATTGLAPGQAHGSGTSSPGSAAGALGSSTSGPGVAGGGMMGAGARGAGGQEETTHTAPGYLLGLGDDSILDGLPKITPAVLGAETAEQYFFD